MRRLEPGLASGEYAALALLGAELRPGIDLLRFEEHVARADLIITGEGSLDQQSLHGKSRVGVAEAAGRAGVAVVAVCGRRDIDARSRARRASTRRTR